MEYKEDDFLLFLEKQQKPSPKPKKRQKPASQKFDFLATLIEDGVDEQIARDWMAVRKAKKAVNTITAYNLLRGELDKITDRYGITDTDAITVCVCRNWMGCRLSFFDNINFTEYGIVPTKPNPNFNFNNNRYGTYNQRQAQRPELNVRTFEDENQEAGF